MFFQWASMLGVCLWLPWRDIRGKNRKRHPDLGPFTTRQVGTTHESLNCDFLKSKVQLRLPAPTTPRFADWKAHTLAERG